MKLTPREQEICIIFASMDLSRYINYKKHVAEQLGISYNTVRMYFKSIFKKFGVNNKIAAQNKVKEFEKEGK